MTTQAPKLREYQGLWLKIAETTEVVVVRCHASFSRRLIQAVRKEKTAANTMRKNLDMPSYGRLQHKIEPILDSKGKVKISFWMTYNGDML